MTQGAVSEAAPICVFCASSPGTSDVYAQATRSVGRAIAESGAMLVYGGGTRGLMGTVAQSALEAGGRVHGIVPHALSGPAVEELVKKARAAHGVESGANGDADAGGPITKGGQSLEGAGESQMEGGTYDGRFETELVDSMHERKARMAELSTGGFVVLPGGFGTFEEVMEMVTWNQLRIHRRPVVVLNINDFYTPLRQQIERAAQEGFIQRVNLSLIKFVDLEAGEDVEQWGTRCLEAIRGWQWDEEAGYKLTWKA